MDLPNVKIVIQWKATCTLCSLWQRFGRAARGAGLEATAILFVDKKDTDEERSKKAEKEALRKEKEGIGTKRRAMNQLNQASKRQHIAEGPPLVNRDTEHEDAIPQILDPKVVQEERRKHYSKRDQTVTKSKGRATKTKGKEVEVGSAMDNFINALREHFKCRRIVTVLFFGNDKVCEYM